MSYLLGTEAFVYVITSDAAYPPATNTTAVTAAFTTRRWAESVESDLIHLSIVTYGELCVLRNAAAGNLSLVYQLNSVLDLLEGEPGKDQVLDLTREDMIHWARIYAVLDDDPDLRLEDSFALAQALSQGFTFVGRRTAIIDELEKIGLRFLDPAEWLARQ